MTKNRVRFLGEHENPSFIREVWFSSFEQPRLIPIGFPKSAINRLDWFKTGRMKNLPGLSIEQVEILSQDDSISTINGICDLTTDDPLRAVATQLDIVKNLAQKDEERALLVSNHLACSDVCLNFAPNFATNGNVLIVPTMYEAFNDFNTVQYTSRIEDFADNVVLNGSKSYVKGAESATHFMVFVGTMVKERNGKVYRRLSTVLVPADAEGLEIEPDFDGFSTVLFEDVEVEPEWVVGRIGYGKQYLDHLKNCQKLLTSQMMHTIIEKRYKDFVQKCQTSEMGNRDMAINAVAKCHLDLMALSGAISQIAARKGYTLDGILPELNSVKIMSNKLAEYSHKFNEILQENGFEIDENNLADYLPKTSDPEPLLYAQVGYSGFQALLGKNVETLKARIGTLFLNPLAMFLPYYHIRRRTGTMFYDRNPKMYEFQKEGFFYGEAKLYERSSSVPTFEQIFNVSFHLIKAQLEWF